MARDKSVVKKQPEISGDLGVFGGMFNPPHVGHLAGAQEVCSKLDLSRILFIPAPRPPHRSAPAIAPEHRLEMTRLAVKDNPRFTISELEFNRPGASYTVDTLQTLTELYPAAQLHLIIGADELNSFPDWHCHEEILELAQLVVMTRPGYSPDPSTTNSQHQPLLVEIPHLDIASRQLRVRARDQKPLRYLVPETVVNYIRKEELYRE